MEEETRQQNQIVDRFEYLTQNKIQSTKSQMKQGNVALTFDVMSFDTRENKAQFPC